MPVLRPPRLAPAPSPPFGFGRFTGPVLWTLHGWMAMFFFASGYAKLTEDEALLALLLGWPAMAQTPVVQAVGWAEVALAGVLALSPAAGPRGGPAARAAAAILMLNTVAMSGYYLTRLDPGLTATNLVLTGLGAGILIGHGRTPFGRRSRGFDGKAS
ncbi:MAG: DoxX family protein [Brevundimonas sp.]|nr:DoxX family protein [Brevundimonas sp.]